MFVRGYRLDNVVLVLRDSNGTLVFNILMAVVMGEIIRELWELGSKASSCEVTRVQVRDAVTAGSLITMMGVHH